MYHARFKKSHYECGYKYGSLLKKNGHILNTCPTFKIDKDRINFAKECIEIYKKYYPEIIDEVKGISDGNGCKFENISALIFSMYCYDVSNRCSCFALRDNNNILFGRNSDFLVSIEKLYMNVLYSLDNSYSFNGNTTAFVEIEDGINEYGLAVGLTFIPIKKVKPGFNVGILTRYLLEKCKTTSEALDKIKSLPIASGGTLTMIDKIGDMAVVELSSDEINIIKSDKYVCATNVFVSDKMKKYNIDFDNWRAVDRYNTLNNALNSNNYSYDFSKDLLSGKYGFICQYDRKTNADTVWSSIYDTKNNLIYRVEGNPSRKNFIIDKRNNKKNNN